MSERADRVLTVVADWFQSVLMLGCGALLIAPMGQGDPEHGFFLVIGFAAGFWLVQVVVALYESRKRPGGWRRPLLLVKGGLIIAVIVAALIRGRLTELLAVALFGAPVFGALGLLGAGVFLLLRYVETKLERRRRS